MKYGYFPGCSLEKNASSYNVSNLAVAKILGLDLQELDDWNCCGATEYISINRYAAYALVARNLALAKKIPSNGQHQLVAPCSLCYMNLQKCEEYMLRDQVFAGEINQALAAGGMSYTPGNMRVRHLLDVLINDIGLEAIQQKVTKPLQGLRVAPYYGCLIVRPAFHEQFDDPEYPTSLDKLLKALGAEVVDYPVKAQCCGGHMTQISEPVAYDLIRRLLKNAADYDADVIACLCPMCQLNLDAYQGNVNKFFKTNYQIPILYFTQLMGLAFGKAAVELKIGKEFVDARPALAKIGAELPPKEEPKKKKPPKEALPMPHMREEG